MIQHNDWPEDAEKSPCARAVTAWIVLVLLTALAFWLCVGLA